MTKLEALGPFALVSRKGRMTNHSQAWTRIAKKLCLAGIAVLVLAGLSFSQSLSDWPEFHNTNMQRSNPYETVLNVSNVGNLQLKWSYATGGGWSSPAVANGVVYVGSGNGNVYALKASTGALLWSYKTGGQVLA